MPSDEPVPYQRICTKCTTDVMKIQNLHSFEWLCHERSAAISTDAPRVKAKVKYFTAHTNIKNPKCSERRVYHSKAKIHIRLD
jgi:hypothetical protein